VQTRESSPVRNGRSTTEPLRAFCSQVILCSYRIRIFFAMTAYITRRIPVVAAVVKPVLSQPVSWYCTTPRASYCCSRLLGLVWTQQPALLESQSTATQRWLATHHDLQTTSVVMVIFLNAPTELVFSNDLHCSQSSVDTVVVAKLAQMSNVKCQQSFVMCPLQIDWRRITIWNDNMLLVAVDTVKQKCFQAAFEHFGRALCSLQRYH